MDQDHPDSPGGGGRTPRKELQGPRPAPLKVRKESHKIKKPPVAPPVMGPTQNLQQASQPPRQPVIIYTVSPKVIHTHPSEFMTLVQRLTGPDATSSSSSSSSQYASTSSGVGNYGSSYNNTSQHISGGISPAARFASIERTKMHSEVVKKYDYDYYVGPSEVRQEVVTPANTNVEHGAGGDGTYTLEGVERTVVFPGILSPGPGSLPPISPNLFSPFFQLDPNINNNLVNLQHGNNNSRSLLEGSHHLLPSPFPANLFTPSPMFSPSSLDVLQRVWDT